MGGTVAIGVFALFISFAQLDVPCYDQTISYQTACESVATVEVLNYYGYDITIDQFIDEYLAVIDKHDEEVVTSDYNIFDRYFVGNPRSYDGWLCNPPVIVDGVYKYFTDIGEANRSPHNSTGVGLNFLLDEVALGHPVVIWVTQGFKPPEPVDLYGNEYFSGNHVVVLSGFDRSRGVVMITDSIDGQFEIGYGKAKSVFDSAGRRSVVIK